MCCARAVPAAAQLTFGGGAARGQQRADRLSRRRDRVRRTAGADVARGHVEISQNGQVLLADTVTYNQRTDTVTASGNVSLSQPTGEIVFADFMELRDSMSEAFRQERANAARRPLAARRQCRAPHQRQPHRADARRLFALRSVQGRPERAAAVAAQGARDRPRQGVAAGRVSRRGHGDRRLAGLLFALHVDARPVGKARQRLSDAVDRELQHPRRACDDPLFPGARTGQGYDLRAALLYQGRPAAGRRIPPALRQRHARRDRQPQPQQCRLRRQHVEPRASSGAATSTSTASSTSTRPTGRGSTCSASPIRPICCASALAIRCSTR